MNERSLPIRWVLIFLLAIAALTFFFPLVSIHIPIAGDQEWSGYDVLAKSRDVDRKLDSFRDIGKSDTASEPSPAPTEPSEPTSPSRSAEIEQMPFSMRTLAFLPVEIGLAFVATAMAILLSFSKSATRAVAFVSFSGGVAAAIAVLHLTVANSDLHVRMQQQMNSITVGDENNPFAGLAKEIANLAVNAMQLKPGTGLYLLGGALLSAALMARMLSTAPAAAPAEVSAEESPRA